MATNTSSTRSTTRYASPERASRSGEDHLRNTRHIALLSTRPTRPTRDAGSLRRLGRLAVLAIFLLAADCGARTGLDVCPQPGEERSCQSTCGSGVIRCVGGSWTPCQIPVAERACTNACGTGSQTCSDGTWSACTVPEAFRSCTAPCGSGQETCVDGVWGACAGPEAGAPVIEAQLWDFEPGNPPDFGVSTAASVPGIDPGIVARTLGADGRPVYAGNPRTPSTTGAANFAEWYHDSGASLTTLITLPFGPSPTNPNLYVSMNPNFFPVDNELYGNELAMGLNVAHNYYFTVTFSLPFRYRGGETFHFASDDDSWVFINRRLAVNLGGLHEVLSGSVDLDANSGALGISIGEVYALDLFYADRLPVQAILDMQVPAADFGVCGDGGIP